MKNLLHQTGNVFTPVAFRPARQVYGGNDGAEGAGGAPPNGAESQKEGEQAKTTDQMQAELNTRVQSLRTSVKKFENDANPAIKDLAKNADDQLKQLETTGQNLSEAEKQNVLTQVERILAEAGQRRGFESTKKDIQIDAEIGKGRIRPMFEETLKPYNDKVSPETLNKIKDAMNTAMGAQTGVINVQMGIGINLEYDAAKFAELSQQADGIAKKMKGEDPAFSDQLVKIYNNFLTERDALVFAEYAKGNECKQHVTSEIAAAKGTIQHDIDKQEGRFSNGILKIESLNQLEKQTVADLDGLKPEEGAKKALVLAHMRDEMNKLIDVNADKKVGDLVSERNKTELTAVTTRLEELRNASGTLQQRMANMQAKGESVPPALIEEARNAFKAFSDQKAASEQMAREMKDPVYRQMVDNLKADQGLNRPLTDPGYESLLKPREPKPAAQDTELPVEQERIDAVAGKNNTIMSTLVPGMNARLDVEGIKVDVSKQPFGYVVNGKVFPEANQAYAEAISVADHELAARAVQMYRGQGEQPAPPVAETAAPAAATPPTEKPAAIPPIAETHDAGAPPGGAPVAETPLPAEPPAQPMEVTLNPSIKLPPG